MDVSENSFVQITQEELDVYQNNTAQLKAMVASQTFGYSVEENPPSPYDRDDD